MIVRGKQEEPNKTANHSEKNQSKSKLFHRNYKQEIFQSKIEPSFEEANDERHFFKVLNKGTRTKKSVTKLTKKSRCQ